MPSLNAITTTAGRAAILAAVAGPTSLVIEDAQLSNTDQSVGIGTTSLTSVVATLAASGSVRPAGPGHVLHVLIVDGSSAAYDVRTIALRLDDGTFLMVYSQAGIIATKAAGSSLHLAFDLTIDADTAATITFGDTDYVLPAAGESSPGIIEIATTAEVDTGSDTVRAVTPYQYARRTSAILAALVASEAEVDAGANTSKIVSPAEFARRVPELVDVHEFTGNVVAAGEYNYDAEKTRTIVLPLSILVPENNTDWVHNESVSTFRMWSIASPARQRLIGFFQVPIGCKLTRLRAKMYQGGAATLDFALYLYKLTHDFTAALTPGSVTAIGNVTAPGTGTQLLTLTPSAHTFDPSTESYQLRVYASDSGSISDNISGLEVQYSDPGPRNMAR